ncbi:MAG: 3-dehydroquinate synthase, partial [Acidimicrobiales bacterium]
SYPIVVGAGVVARLAELVPAGAGRAAIVSQDGIPVAVGPGIEAARFLIGPGEEAKNLATVEDLCRGFARFGLSRRDVVVAVGGGVVTDTAGFAAAAYHRGVAVVHVATTLVAQVDAAIGGKTGVNLPEGKNLVGAFWQPAAVICDTDTLATLAPHERLNGLGEVAKYHFLGVPEGLAEGPIDELVAACAALKAAVVSGDEREQTGRRAALNYGHTLGHALETVGRYDLRHGEAVAIGLVFAARLAHRLGRIDPARVAGHEAVVAGYGLPTTLPPGADPAALVELMARDKKRTGAGLAFVLDGPGGVEPVAGVEPALVADVLATWAGAGSEV